MLLPAPHDVGGTVVDSVPTGTSPWGVAVDPLNGNVYVANDNSQNVSVINSTREEVIASIPVGANPCGVAVDPENGDVYVANGGSGNVSVIDGATNSVITSVGVMGGPCSIAVDSSTGQIWVSSEVGSCFSTGYVSVINGSTNSLAAQIPAGLCPGGVVVDEQNGDVYVTDGNRAGNNTDNLTVFDGLTDRLVGWSVDFVSPVIGPGSVLALDSRSGEIYVSDSCSGICIINVTTDQLVGSLPIDEGEGEGEAFDSSNGFVYFTSTYSNDLIAVNATTQSEVGAVPVGLDPYGVQVDAKSGYLYIANWGSSNVSVVDPVWITGVGINPTSATLPVNGSTHFSSTPSCQGGPCPSLITYRWSLTNGLGALNGTLGKSVVFLSGPLAGEVHLFLNATLRGDTVEGVPCAITILAVLTRVTVTPSSISLFVGGSTMFTASAICSGGTCPTDIVYSWTASNDLGWLNASTGSLVTFTSGSTPGTVILTLNASQNGLEVMAPPVPITIAAMPLMSVAIAPSSVTLGTGQSAALVAVTVCSSTPCPLGISFSWGVANSRVALNSSVGSSVEITASTNSGEDFVFLNASLDGTTQSATPVSISILASSDLLHVDANGTLALGCNGQVPTPATATFAATIRGGTYPYHLDWWYGDGASSQAEAPVHVYNQSWPYPFTPKLTVSDSSGLQVTKNVSLQFGPTPSCSAPAGTGPGWGGLVLWSVAGLITTVGVVVFLVRVKRKNRSVEPPPNETS